MCIFLSILINIRTSNCVISNSLVVFDGTGPSAGGNKPENVSPWRRQQAESQQKRDEKNSPTKYPPDLKERREESERKTIWVPMLYNVKGSLSSIMLQW